MRRGRERWPLQFGLRVAAGARAAVFGAAGAAGAAPPVAAGGLVASYQVLSVQGINDRLGVGLPELGNTVWMVGGAGFGPMLPSEGLVSGGFGAGGEVKAVGDGGKEVRLAVGYGGPWVGYQRELAGKFWVQTGVGVAFGGATLTVFTAQDSNTFDTTVPNQVTYSRFIFGLLPELTVAWSLTPFMHVRAGVGYFFDTRIGGEWESARGQAVSNAPGDSFSGVQCRLGIVWGPGWAREFD